MARQKHRDGKVSEKKDRSVGLEKSEVKVKKEKENKWL